MVEIVRGPLTLEGRHVAVERATRQLANSFLDDSRLRRTWSPGVDFPLKEIAEQGPNLSSESVDLLEGFMGVEEYVGDYAEAGLVSFRGSRSREDIHLQWSFEEMRHGLGLMQVLTTSGVRTQDQIDDYLDKLAKSRWVPSQHVGLGSPISAVVYGGEQEMGTYINYRSLRRRIRMECGLPENITIEERQRGKQFGISEAIHRIELDEIAHFGLYLKMVKIYLAYFPEETLETIKEVFSNFKMPALRLLPNRQQFIRALLKTEVYNEQVHRNSTHIPVLKAFGFEDEQALDEAIAQAKAQTEYLNL